MKRAIAVALLALVLIGCGESNAEQEKRRTQEIIDAIHNP